MDRRWLCTLGVQCVCEISGTYNGRKRPPLSVISSHHQHQQPTNTGNCSSINVRTLVNSCLVCVYAEQVNLAQCPICLSQFDDTVRPLDGFFSFHGDGCFKFCRLANAGAAWAPPLTSGLRNGAFSRFTHDSITCTMDDPEMILFVAFLDEGNTGYSRPVAGGCTNMRSIAGKKGR